MARDEGGLGLADAGADVDAFGRAGVASPTTNVAADVGWVTARCFSRPPKRQTIYALRLCDSKRREREAVTRPRMPLTPDQLPDDIAELKQRLIASAAELTAKTAELEAAKNGLVVTQLTIEKLKAQIAKLRREKFGASSERIERVIAQLELALEEAEMAKAEAAASAPEQPEPETPAPSTDDQSAETPAPEKKKRRALPPEFPRHDVVHMPADVCKTCGGSELRIVGESVSEVLEYIPGRFKVNRHVRPACSCRKCETMMQAPMPELPIPRGMAGPSFLAHIAIAKFCDHLPLL